ncbi:hypothetical protein PMAYCL1PPCAC_10565 [Pristionchus mayeri]|uniref:Uncharacterized protein n=1 Tax=Pristionchus mayeri TaxID=1317129 RepID=A0AAN5CD25_9BILA|nr:hypothetical protein PMAYCL1PPCAC_10565 [Pristionchus mayeri]
MVYENKLFFEVETISADWTKSSISVISSMIVSGSIFSSSKTQHICSLFILKTRGWTSAEPHTRPSIEIGRTALSISLRSVESSRLDMNI